ncbi:MAG: amino acid synthesis family protein, partial [Proteobacteria bacterium]|nr:amino acid synthesis family protein [Pseudomonadota bacterium]
MPDFPIRKIALQIEEIFHEGGPSPEKPRLRGAIMAVCANPFARAYHANLQPAFEDLKPLGLMLTDRLIAALCGRDGIDGYGKGTLVGEAGEAEHGALWHVPGGYAMRERLGESRAIVPSAMKVAGMGATLDVPLGHVNAAYVRSHFDAITVSVPDGPRAGELVFVLAMSAGP